MNVFLGILAVLGFGALIATAVAYRRTANTVTNTAGRLNNEGLLGFLFPSQAALASQRLLPGQSNTPAYENPLAYAGAANQLTQAGLSIARYVQDQPKTSTGDTSISSIFPDDISYGTQSGPSISGKEYLARMQNSGSGSFTRTPAPPSDMINDSSQVID